MVKRAQTLETFSRRFQLCILRDYFVKRNALGNEPVDFSRKCQLQPLKKKRNILLRFHKKSIGFIKKAHFSYFRKNSQKFSGS